MKVNRREFIKISSISSASLFVPEFIKAFGMQFDARNTNGKKLVIIQLSGGNDGLNTVVPYRNDLYYKARPGLGLKKEELFILNDEAGLNNNLEGLADLFNDGNLAILNNVGYPNPNRSHFRSTDIWQSASDEKQVLQTGWIGRFLDASCEGSCAKPHAAIELDDTLSLALKGEQMKGLALRDPRLLHLATQNQIIRKASAAHISDHEHPGVEYLYKTLAETMQSADYLYAQSKIYQTKKVYPNNDFAQRMKSIAELINSGSDTMIYYVSLGGFDTHAMQKGQQGRMLKMYSEALKVFCDDLKEKNRFDETLVLSFSEFGRRVKQNAGGGTDHGTANNVFIAGGKLKKASILNAMPDLENLDEGDLIYKLDFRQIYASILENFLLILKSTQARDNLL